MTKNTNLLPVLILSFILWFMNPFPALAQAGAPHGNSDDAPDCSSSESAFLGIGTGENGAAQAFLVFCVDSSRETETRQELPKAFDCQGESPRIDLFKDGRMTAIQAYCNYKLPKRLFRFTGTTHLSSLQNVLKLAGIDVLEVLVSPPTKGTASCDPPSRKDESPAAEAGTCFYSLTGAPGDPREIRYSIGYTLPLVLRDIAILCFLLLIPILLTIRFRRLAHQVPAESKPAVVFSYFRFLRWTVLLGGLIWWTAIDLLNADEMLRFLLADTASAGNDSSIITAWILLWIPPVVIYFLCLTLSSPLHALRGVSRSQTQALNQSFWSVARLVLPLALLFLGIVEFSASPRLAVLLLAASVATGQITRRKLAKAYGMELHALTAGELRDRAFAIAEKARTKLNQLYVFPAEQIRMANAFAHAAKNIFLTDYLVKNLNKREMNAIIGHEITHLQKKHIRSRILIVIFWVIGISLLTVWFGDWLPPGFPAGPAFYAFLLLSIFVVARSNEFAADAGALKLTGDAEAIITGFARLSRLNTMPLHWSKFDEQMLTHPSTMRRIRRIAKLGGLHEARLPELLAQSAAPPTDVYSIPPTALPSGKVFSTQFKSRVSLSVSWIIILTTVLIPILIAQLILWTHVSGSVRMIVYLIGIASAIAIQLLLADFLPLMRMSKLECSLREKFQKQGVGPQVTSGVFVSLAPDSMPRLYESNWAWDIGYLSVSAESLLYWGEEARFIIPRERIKRISLGPGPVNWFKTRSVYISWQDDAGAKHVFNLRPLDTRSMRSMARQTIQLADDLEKWHRGVQDLARSVLIHCDAQNRTQDTLQPPAFGQVTGVSPRILADGDHLVKFLVFDTFIATLMFILLGFPAPFTSAPAPSSTLSDLNLLGATFFYVLVTVWVVRAVMIWPYRRFREEKQVPVDT